jgi:hypothetical protein
VVLLLQFVSCSLIDEISKSAAGKVLRRVRTE